MLYGTKETRPGGALTFFLGLGRTRCLFGNRGCEVPKRGASATWAGKSERDVGI